VRRCGYWFTAIQIRLSFIEFNLNWNGLRNDPECNQLKQQWFFQYPWRPASLAWVWWPCFEFRRKAYAFSIIAGVTQGCLYASFCIA